MVQSSIQVTIKKKANELGDLMSIKTQYPAFTKYDFEVFQVPGLENRMEAIREAIRPKFELYGQAIASYLAPKLGEEVFVHIAKHARRTVNPPDETWVAWATNKRGYKAHPHFQLGLRNSYLFAWFSLIYECEKKQPFARRLQEQKQLWDQLPDHFYLSEDHTKPDVTPIQGMTDDQIMQILDRLAKVKKAEFLCGIAIPPEEIIRLSGEQLLQKLEQTFDQLLPLYHLAIQS